MSRKIVLLKTVMWGIVGVLIGVLAERFLLVGGVGTDLSETTSAWIKIAVGLGITAGVLWLCILPFHKRSGVDQNSGEEAAPVSEMSDFNPAVMKLLLPNSLAGPRRYSLAVIIAAALTIALLPPEALLGTQTESSPVAASRTVEVLAVQGNEGVGYKLLAEEKGGMPVNGAERLVLMVLDGNRNGKLVFFPHEEHVSYLGDEEACSSCHHMNMPFDQNSSCNECHRDMVNTTDIFSHSSHVEKLGDKDGCVACHKSPEQVKSRKNATSCAECHGGMVVKDSFIEQGEGGLKGHAVGYKDAMHGLCIGCHFESDPVDCSSCHRDTKANQLSRMGPYGTARLEK